MQSAIHDGLKKSRPEPQKYLCSEPALATDQGPAAVVLRKNVNSKSRDLLHPLTKNLRTHHHTGIPQTPEFEPGLNLPSLDADACGVAPPESSTSPSGFENLKFPQLCRDVVDLKIKARVYEAAFKGSEEQQAKRTKAHDKRLGEIEAENSSLKDEIIALTQEVKSLNEGRSRAERALMEVCIGKSDVMDELRSMKEEKATLEAQMELMEGSLKSLLKKNGSRHKAARKSRAKEKSKLTTAIASLKRNAVVVAAGLGRDKKRRKSLARKNGELRTRLKMVENRLRFVRQENVLLKEEKASLDHARLAVLDIVESVEKTRRLCGRV